MLGILPSGELEQAISYAVKVIEIDRLTIRDAEEIAVVILAIVEAKQGKLESAESGLKSA